MPAIVSTVPGLSADAALATLRDLTGLAAAPFDDFTREHSDPRVLADLLVKQGKLTTFQAERWLQGRGAELVLGEYVLLGPLGEGGMGWVFKARHRLMDRLVAVKLMRPHLLSNPDAVIRFRREIHLAAQLAHPNVVTAHHAEQVGDTYFLAMELCAGTDLGRLVRQRGPLPVAEACSYIRQAACGLAHAHDKGLVHRDIKPSNLLVTPEGVVKLLDLGLARLRVATARPGADNPVTRDGAVLGTPDFLAPEQARDPQAADIRSDLYGLGCTLYYALSGHAPFPGGSDVEKLLRHQLEEPTPLGQLRPDLPPALIEVVRRLIAKDPAARYQEPGEVAQALAPFAGPVAPHVIVAEGLSSLPTAFPTWSAPSLPESSPTAPPPAKRFQLRRRAVAVTVGAALAVGLAAVTFAPAPRAREGAATTSPGTMVARPIPPPAPRQWDPILTLPTHADMCPNTVAFAPDSRVLAVAYGDMENPRRRGAVKLWNADTGADLATLRGHEAGVRSAAFSPDGQTLASGSADGNETAVAGEIILWDVGKKERRTTLAGHKGGTDSLAFTPDGKMLVSVGWDTKVRLWDVASGKELAALEGHKKRLMCVAISPDGTLAATGGLDQTARLWDLAARKEVAVLKPDRECGDVYAVAFSPDGRDLAVATGIAGLKTNASPEVMIWNVAQRHLQGKGLSHWFHVTGVRYTPDGAALLTADAGGFVRLWDPDVCPEKRAYKWHEDVVVSLAFSPDGTRLATSSWDKKVRIWRGR